jgi:hypothetical protein
VYGKANSATNFPSLYYLVDKVLVLSLKDFDALLKSLDMSLKELILAEMAVVRKCFVRA